MRLTLGATTLELSHRTAVMGIVNRTPDSFYDRGETYALEAALARALDHIAAGADIVDVGGVRAGPGPPVSEQEERERVLPLVEAIREHSAVPLSVETARPAVAEAAVAAGANIVNDVSGLREPALADLVAATPGSALVVMHSGVGPRARPFRPTYRPDVTTVVAARCRELAARAEARGVAPEQIVVDPGHDFGKNTLHSLELTRRLPELCALGYPVLVALSNKDFLGETLGVGLEQRLPASLAAAVVAVQRGARIVRAHEARETVAAVRTAEAILGWRLPAQCLRGLE